MGASKNGVPKSDVAATSQAASRHKARLAGPPMAETDPRVLSWAAAVLDEAGRAGLLDSETEHVSFRAPRVLVEAAKRETGLASTTELGLVALAVLARPDPVSEAMKRLRGRLGERHTLEY